MSNKKLINVTLGKFIPDSGYIKWSPAPFNDHGVTNQAYATVQSALSVTYFLEKGFCGSLLLSPASSEPLYCIGT